MYTHSLTNSVYLYSLDVERLCSSLETIADAGDGHWRDLTEEGQAKEEFPTSERVKLSVFLRVVLDSCPVIASNQPLQVSFSYWIRTTLPSTSFDIHFVCWPLLLVWYQRLFLRLLYYFCNKICKIVPIQYHGNNMTCTLHAVLDCNSYIKLWEPIIWVWSDGFQNEKLYSLALNMAFQTMCSVWIFLSSQKWANFEKKPWTISGWFCQNRVIFNIFELNTESYRVFRGLSEYHKIVEIGWTELEL